MRVMKFGGTSLSTSKRLVTVCKLIEEANREEFVVVVTSAPAGVTNLLQKFVDRPPPEPIAGSASGSPPTVPGALGELEKIVNGLLVGLTPGAAHLQETDLDSLRTGLEYILSEVEGIAIRCGRTGRWEPDLTDRILGAGERLSSHLLASLLTLRGTPAHPLEAREMIRTDSTFGGAAIDHQETARLLRQRLVDLPGGVVPIIPGFTGGDSLHRATTLGRGSSDLTASLVGAALSVRVVEIWTDVDGIHAHDPAHRPSSPILPWLDYDQARRMARQGARVLHPETLDPLQPLKIPLQIRNTLRPQARGTWVGPAGTTGFSEAKPPAPTTGAQVPIPIHLVLAGASGKVASALLEQLRAFRPEISARTGMDLRIGMAFNSRRKVASAAGFPPGEVAEHLQQGEAADLEEVLAGLISGRMGRPVFVDLTASPEVAGTYERILGASIPVVTANKIALSGKTEDYRKLLAAAEASGAPFRYETTVGAALPLVEAVRKRYRCGDDPAVVDAALSGTLAFVLSRVGEGARFSHAVAEARRRGFTEPDPREDLLGADVGRKLLILLREAGVMLEPEAITVESLIPAEISHISDPAEFLTALGDFDDKWTERRSAAEARGERLAYTAHFGGRTGEVGVRSLPESHPLARLGPSENLLLLTTAHYSKLPLTIAGPGAGPGITASGVLSDILSVAEGAYGGGVSDFECSDQAEGKASDRTGPRTSGPRGRRVA